MSDPDTIINIEKSNLEKSSHLFHLVDPSPWPFFCALCVLMLTVGAVMYMHFYKNGFFIMIYAFFMLTSILVFWWFDVIDESFVQGKHTFIVQRGLKLGMLLFILSEVMFFFAFFWAFFHSSLSPTIEMGAMWPPTGIEVFNPWDVPFLNTLVLLSSGVAVTWSHHGLLCGSKKDALFGLVVTMFLAVVFTVLQLYEYMSAPFSIADGVYGSTFFMTTGFHGFHVMVGSLFLCVCLFRLFKNQFTMEHHVGFESAIWYWHFVDVIWLFLFVSMYWWGNL